MYLLELNPEDDELGIMIDDPRPRLADDDDDPNPWDDDEEDSPDPPGSDWEYKLPIFS